MAVKEMGPDYKEMDSDYKEMSPDYKDPLFLGTTTIPGHEVPAFTSGQAILVELEKRVKNKHHIDDVMSGPTNVVKWFQRVFPELVEWSDIGNLRQEDFGAWKKHGNQVTIELDPEPWNPDEKGKDVYVGGPAAIFAATIQAKSEESENVLYAHDGIRATSNWKGSASYYHIRDAMPVYHWPDNHGIYVLFTTLWHALERRFSYSSYIRKIQTDPNWNKLRICYKSLFAEPFIGFLFTKNQKFAMRDIGLHIKGTCWAGRRDKSVYMSTHHAHLTHVILDKLGLTEMILMKSNDISRTIHLHLGGGHIAANPVFEELRKTVGNIVEFRKLSETEYLDRGYDSPLVTQAVEFPRDGYFPPSIGYDMENLIKENNGEVRDDLRLKKILVQPLDEGNDVTVSRVVWENMTTGASTSTPVNSLYASLGPSMKGLLMVDPVTKTADPVKDNLLEQMMWASGTSIVYMVKIDKDIVEERKMIKFRDHIDSHNKHIVRLAEKELIVDGKAFQVFILQTSAGGHFPVKSVHAECALNVTKATVIPLMELDQEGFEFEILTVRSCARGISANNVFRLTAPAANMVMIYGIGGIGMTTMVPNALLMKAVMGLRIKMGKQWFTEGEFDRRLEDSRFGQIPHWKRSTPFRRNYKPFVDHRRRTVAKRFFPQAHLHNHDQQKFGILSVAVQHFRRGLRLLKRV